MSPYLYIIITGVIALVIILISPSDGFFKSYGNYFKKFSWRAWLTIIFSTLTILLTIYNHYFTTEAARMKEKQIQALELERYQNQKELLETSLSYIEQLEEKNKIIIELTKENSNLSKEALKQITGSDSYAYLDVAYWNDYEIDHIPELILKTKGDYPIHDLSIRIKRIEQIDTIQHQFNYESVSYSQKEIYFQRFGTIHKPATEISIGSIANVNSSQLYLIITLLARNGEVEQHLIFEKVDEKVWSYANKVWSYVYEPTGGFAIKLMQEVYSKYFPKNKIGWLH